MYRRKTKPKKISGTGDRNLKYLLLVKYINLEGKSHPVKKSHVFAIQSLDQNVLSAFNV